jgi:hypothetical protein
MTERKPFQFKKIKEKEYEPVHLPPAWCGAICRNAMSEVCVENCAIKRDCSAFEPKPNLKLADMPRFPKTEGMSRDEKFASVTVYLAKIVDHLNGNDDEYHTFLVNRPPVRPEVVGSYKAIAEVATGIQEALVETATEDDK